MTMDEINATTRAPAMPIVFVRCYITNGYFSEFYFSIEVSQ